MPGATVFGIDFSLSKIRGVRIKGRVIDATTGRPPDNNPSIWLSLRDPIGEDYNLDTTGRGKATYNRTDGTFEFRDMPPGVYGVVASALVGQTRLSARLAPERTGSVSIEVRDSDVEGLVVTLASGASLPGRLRVEGRRDIDLTTFFSSGTKAVALEPWFNGGPPRIPGGALTSWAEIKAEGVFRIENVLPGDYRLEVGVLLPGMYIKEARFGVTDILTQPFRFNGNDTRDLEILLSPNVASLEGIVMDSSASPAPDAQVVLIPKGSRHRIDLFKTAVTDHDGRFALTNFAPGDYSLYAWEAIEPNRWFDRDFVDADEQYAQSVQLPESSRQTVTLKLIAARKP
jgi:5-hydroxyisourate hydrolase-like protein (transthyretin family)